MKRKISLRMSLLFLFFSLQVAGIVTGRFTDTKFFCWAPYDEISFYKITTIINGKELKDDEVFTRYRERKTGRENRSIHNIISTVRQYETTYGENDGAAVEISYMTNGHRKETWIWPDDKIISKN